MENLLAGAGSGVPPGAELGLGRGGHGGRGGGGGPPRPRHTRHCQVGQSRGVQHRGVHAAAKRINILLLSYVCETKKIYYAF